MSDSTPLDDSRTARERMLAGDWYVADDPELGEMHRRGVQLAEAYHRAEVAGEPGARGLLESLLGELGDGAYVQPPLVVDYGDNIRIGARTFVNYHLTALDVAAITIGEDCQIGPNVQLLTPTHPIDPEPRRAKVEAARPIVIEDNVWLGGGVIVCPGVTIGKDSVVGAGSVVTKDIPPRVVAAGNPARVLREIP
ncbi:sugar O-acetyltransferase [Demequina sp. NBRC 110056]|uniref:sugar O-acetyltransferase n=1 Tax=Demequina sp. NBRC 110056 TaxID=1570345 RepID=UPI000A075149|nr:sugar O-acetyltransferase [Demequina sp. NBRC 110056]